MKNAPGESGASSMVKSWNFGALNSNLRGKDEETAAAMGRQDFGEGISFLPWVNVFGGHWSEQDGMSVKCEGSVDWLLAA